MIEDVINKKETTVGKPEICQTISNNTGLPLNLVSKFYDAYHNTVIEAVADNKKVIIRGFGTFSTRYQKSHLARNPQTNEPIVVSDKAKATFRFGETFLRVIKERFEELKSRLG